MPREFVCYCSIAVPCIWYIDFLPPRTLFGASCRCSFSKQTVFSVCQQYTQQSLCYFFPWPTCLCLCFWLLLLLMLLMLLMLLLFLLLLLVLVLVLLLFLLLLFVVVVGVGVVVVVGVGVGVGVVVVVCCLVLLLLFLFLFLLLLFVVGVGVVVVLVVFSFFQSEPLSSTFRLTYQLFWDSSRRISVLCSTHTVAIRFAPAHFRACPVPTVDNTPKCSTNFHGFLLTQLDDGWPESVEEQGLLLFVLRHYITRQYIKDVV